MKPIYRPYRLINCNELEIFQNNFSVILEKWNKYYARKQLKIELIRPTLRSNKSIDIANNFVLLKQEEHLFAMLDINYLSVIKESIFSDSSDCFNAICEDLFKSLLKEFLALDSLELISGPICNKEWFYTGSPVLKLKLSTVDSFFDLYLHPYWVLTQLPKPRCTANALGNLDTALAEKKLECTVELEPLFISLDTLSRLQKGDLLKSSHWVDKPLLLCHQQQRICDVVAGKQSHHKSIQLRNIR